MVRAGVLGDVTEVHVWTNRPIWPQAPAVTKRPPKTADARRASTGKRSSGRPRCGRTPGTTRQDGIAGRTTISHWRGWWDFGTGAIGDMACHTANMAFMALKLGAPDACLGRGRRREPRDLPELRATRRMKFPARDDMPPVTLHWYEGKKDGKKLTAAGGTGREGDRARHQPAAEEAGGQRLDPRRLEGHRLFAERLRRRGVLQHRRGGERKLKARDAAEQQQGDQGQKNEWVEAIKAGKPEMALSNFDYAGLLTAAFLLGQRRGPHRQAVHLGRREVHGDRQPGRREVHPPRVPQGLGSDRVQRVGAGRKTCETEEVGATSPRLLASRCSLTREKM